MHASIINMYSLLLLLTGLRSRVLYYQNEFIIVVDQAEMEVVKTGMQHGDLSLDAYTQVTSIPYFWFKIGIYSLTEIITTGLGRMFGPGPLPSRATAIHKVTLL